MSTTGGNLCLFLVFLCTLAELLLISVQKSPEISFENDDVFRVSAF